MPPPIPPTPANIFNIGLVGIVLGLVLALIFPTPSGFQVNVFTVVLSLSGACMASAITGFLEIDSKWVKAGGPLGVLVFLCFFISKTIPT